MTYFKNTTSGTNDFSANPVNKKVGDGKTVVIPARYGEGDDVFGRYAGDMLRCILDDLSGLKVMASGLAAANGGSTSGVIVYTLKTDMEPF